MSPSSSSFVHISIMGNAASSPADRSQRSFPGSALLDNLHCGSIDDTDETASPRSHKATGGKDKSRNDSGKGDGSSHANAGFSQLFSKADILCAQSPSSMDGGDAPHMDFEDDEYQDFNKSIGRKKDVDGAPNSTAAAATAAHATTTSSSTSANPTSALFARALVSEVTDNPKTMTPAAMAEREKRLLKAQERAKKADKKKDGPKPVGTPGGVGSPSVCGSLAQTLIGNSETIDADEPHEKSSVLPPNSLSENRAQVGGSETNSLAADTPGKHTVTIGLSLSRRHSIGHPDTVTRQTAFDFNELQDRQYKYVSSTDSCGWRAGGGERGGPQPSSDFNDDDDHPLGTLGGLGGTPFASPAGGASFASPKVNSQPSTPAGAQNHKIAAPDTVHIPIIHIDCESPQQVDYIITTLARGEIFIPHMAVLPEALSVSGISPPDLVVRFGTERNDDMPPDEWPNWCLEFMHNQLYEYFLGIGARWMKRPFSITLAKKVRWKTVKHMNRYFAHAERVIDAWREKGPQYLDPQLAYIEGGATPEEVARPHGIYLLRNGVPTNYFPPNFDPPYTTKMTRSLLLNVLGKSWDKKRREWTSEPIPMLMTPSMLLSHMCGCSDNTTGGFMANEVTLAQKIDTSTIPDHAAIRSENPKRHKRKDSASSTPVSNTGSSAPAAEKMVSNVPPPEPARSQIAETDVAVAEPQDLDARSPASSGSSGERQRQRERHGPMKQIVKDATTARQQVDPEEDITSLLQSSNEPPSTMSKFSSEFTLKLSSDLEDELEGLQLAATGTSTSKSSSKYGKAPTPEVSSQSQPTSARSSPAAVTATTTTNVFKEKSTNDLKPLTPLSTTTNNKSIPSPHDSDTGTLNTGLDSKSAAGGAISDVGQPSVTGTNSTIMHMNLSTEMYIKKELERRQTQAREEKKEENNPDLSCDDDWLDSLVSFSVAYTMTLFCTVFHCSYHLYDFFSRCRRHRVQPEWYKHHKNDDESTRRVGRPWKRSVLDKLL